MAIAETNVTSSVDTSQLWLASTALNHGIWQTKQENTSGRTREPRRCRLSVDRVVALLEFNVSMYQEFGKTVQCLEDPTKSWRYRSQWNAAHGNLAKYKTSTGHLTAQGGGSLGLKAKWQSKRYFGTPFLLIGLLCHRFHVHLNLWPSGSQKLESFTSFAHFAEWRKQFARQWALNGSHAQNTADSRLLQHARIGALRLSNINKLPWHCGLLETLHGTLLAA